MSDQPIADVNAEETVPIPPKKSGGSNKVVLIILGVVVACMLIFGVVLTAGFFYVKNRGANIVKDIAKTQGIDVKNIDSEKGTAEYSIKTEDGEITASVSKELPDDFPTDQLSVYDGVITTTNRMNISGTKTWSIVMQTEDSPKEVGDTIKQDFIDNGWEIVMEQDSDNSSMKSAKKDNYSAIVSYQTDKKSEGTGKEVTRVSYNLTHRDKSKE